MRGNLVQQNPDNEPASALLQKIKNHRSELIKSGSIKKPKILSEVSVEEQYFPLPENWEWVRLGTLFDSIISGGTPSKRNPAFWGGEIPWASVKDLGKSKYLDTTQDHITEAGLQAGSKLAATGDVLICTRMGLGKVAICSRPIAINQDLKAVKVSPKTALDYFFLAYTTLDITGTGTTVSGITQEKLLNYVIGLPPIEEQHRIVQKVDELMALCDRLEQQTSDQIAAHDTLVDTLLGTLTQSQNATELAENWTRLAAHFDTLFTTEKSIDKLKQTVLQLAVMGRLVEQNLRDHPANTLLTKIEETKTSLYLAGTIKKPKHLPLITEDEQYISLPEGWAWARFGQTGYTRLGKMLDKAKNSGTEKPYLRNTNVQWWRVDVKDIKTFKLENYELCEYKLEDGDLLICEGGEPGRCAVWRHSDMEMYFQKAIHRHRTLGLCSPDYLKICLTVDCDNGRLSERFTGATIKHLPGDKLMAHLCPIPPLEEQHRITKKTDELIALCDQLKERLNQSSETRCQLAESIVENALQ